MHEKTNYCFHTFRSDLDGMRKEKRPDNGTAARKNTGGRNTAGRSGKTVEPMIIEMDWSNDFE